MKYFSGPWAFRLTVLAAFLLLASVPLLADCQLLCRNIDCFKDAGANQVYRFAVNNGWELFATSNDGALQTPHPNPGVGLFDNCPNEALDCSIITSQSTVGECPPVNQCVRVGLAAQGTCVKNNS
jgi:hypothetical protein